MGYSYNIRNMPVIWGYSYNMATLTIARGAHRTFWLLYCVKTNTTCSHTPTIILCNDARMLVLLVMMTMTTTDQPTDKRWCAAVPPLYILESHWKTNPTSCALFWASHSHLSQVKGDGIPCCWFAPLLPKRKLNASRRKKRCTYNLL